LSNGLTMATISFPSRTATGTILCLRAKGREMSVDEAVAYALPNTG